MNKKIIIIGLALIIFGIGIFGWMTKDEHVDASVDLPLEDLAEWYASETFDESSYDEVVIEHEDEEGFVYYATYKDGKCINMGKFSKKYFEELYSVDD